MRFRDRLYVFLRRKLFGLIRVTISQISVTNPRVRNLVSGNEISGYKVTESFVHLQSGTSFFLTGQRKVMIDESSGWHPIIAQNYFGIVPQVSDQTTKIWNSVVIANPNNYFHWFTEELIRYLSIDKHQQFCAHRSLPEYARISLLALNIEPKYYEDNWVFMRNQILYPRIPVSENLKNLSYNSLAAQVRDFVRPCDCHPHSDFSKIYISRKSSARPLPNEKEIEDFFLSFGFKILYFENLSFSCQVTIVSGVDVLAGAHGAGLTNILWLGDSAKVLEVMPPDFHNPCYYDLATNLGLDYKCVDFYESTELFVELSSIIQDWTVTEN